MMCQSFIPSTFLVELSKTQSTASSIGVIIKGIEPNPAIVGSHFETNNGRTGVLATANLVTRTIPLITPPGIATLAKGIRS